MSRETEPREDMHLVQIVQTKMTILLFPVFGDTDLKYMEREKIEEETTLGLYLFAVFLMSSVLF
jgi:hypothetical protein